MNVAVGQHDVVIVGGGPTGMMLAAELTLAKVDVVVVERRATPDVSGSRAGGLHSRTIEVLDQRGVAERFLSEGKTAQVATFSWIPLDISDFPTRHPYGLALWQNHFERIFAGWIQELGVPILRDLEVTGFAQHDDGVDVQVSDDRQLRARYLVGCDGGRSVIRKEAGIDFSGWEASTSSLIAEVELADEPEWGVRTDERGIHGLSRLDNDGPVRVMLSEPPALHTGEPTLQELKEALTEVYGTDFGVHSVSWLSRFTDSSRQAVAYREKRVLLAGDAAHVHSPMGGQGLNIGVQDAVNLGWKLAQVVKGTSTEDLLDTYQAERYPIGARALRTTMAAVGLNRRNDRIDALREVVSELLAMEEPRKSLAGRMSGLDVHYELGAGHPLLGRRMPDLDMSAKEGVVRMYHLLHDARPVLVNLGDRGDLQISGWEERIRLVDVRFDGRWELPVLGEVPAPSGLLVRPDGYVAWVGEGNDAGLRDSLTNWFGPPFPN